MKIVKIMNAAIGATQERCFITKKAGKQTLDKTERMYYDKLYETTGPSTHRPVQIVKSWYKAYKLNMDRLDLVDELNAPFKHKGSLATFIERIFNKG